MSLLASYTVLDAGYKNALLQIITGLEDSSADPLSVGTVNTPVTSGVSIESSIPDPVIFSFPYSDGSTNVRALLGKIVSQGGVPASTCTYTVLKSPVSGTSDDWTPVSATAGSDITFTDGATPMPGNVATNPHGIAWVGNWLYIIDYESQKIYRVGKTDLDNIANGGTYTPYAFDVSAIAPPLPVDAKGQAIIALQNGGQNYLFALYLVNDSSGANYRPSILVRLNVDSGNGNITYAGPNNQVTLGLNSQEIIPVSKTGGPVTLLIPEIGGYQSGGTTNGTASDIYAVEAFAASLTASQLVTGDDPATTGHSYDIRAIAASSDARDGATVYILAATYTSSYSGANWRLYKTTVWQLIPTPLPSPVPTLSELVSNGVLIPADQDDSTAGTPGYFWDILFENAPSATAARLWSLRGSPILATLANYYGSPTASGSNPYVFFNTGTQLGGENVNSFDLTAETLRQAQRGVSLKRGFRLSAATRAAIKSAKAQEEK